MSYSMLCRTLTIFSQATETASFLHLLFVAFCLNKKKSNQPFSSKNKHIYFGLVAVAMTTAFWILMVPKTSNNFCWKHDILVWNWIIGSGYTFSLTATTYYLLKTLTSKVDEKVE